VLPRKSIYSRGRPFRRVDDGFGGIVGRAFQVVDADCNRTLRLSPDDTIRYTYSADVASPSLSNRSS